jgi:hypothetical protein
MDFPDPDRPYGETPVPPTGVSSFDSSSLTGHHEVGIVTPATGTDEALANRERGSRGRMAICSVSTKRVYWAALMPYWGGCTVAGLVADTLRPLAAQ